MTKRHVLLLTAVLGMAAAQTSTPAPAPATGSVGAAPRNASRDLNLTDAPITVNTGSYVGPLSVLLASIAKSAGYDVVFNFNVDALALIDGAIVNPGTGAAPTTGTAPAATAPTTNYASATGKPQELSAKPIAYNFVRKPFNEVWQLLMDVYELNYEVIRLGSGNVLRISQRPRQLSIVLTHTTAAVAREKATEFFGEAAYEDRQYVDAGGKTYTGKQFVGYRLPDTLKILTDAENNRLIVGGTNDQVEKVRSFISTIDIPKAATPAIAQGQSIYTVKGSVADVTSVLGVQFPALKVTPFGQRQQVLLNGAQADLTGALKLLELVDQAPTTAAPEGTASQVYVVKGQQQDAAGVLAAQYPALKVTPVGNTGQLILSGPQTQLTAALTLLGQVDRAVPAASQVTQRVFTLLNASAEEVKATLEGTLARDLTDAAPTPVTNVPVNATDANGNSVAVTVPTTAPAAPQASTAAPAASAAGAVATIIADRRTNTLIVRGTAEQVTQIADLIPQLDRVVPQINVQVRIQEVTEQAIRTLGMNWKVNFGGFNVSVGASDGLGVSFDPTMSFMGFNVFPALKALENQGLTRRVYDGTLTMQSGQRSLASASGATNASSTAAASVKSGGRAEINIPSSAGNIVRQIDYGINLDFFNPQVAPDGTITLRVRGQVNQPAGPLPTSGVPNILNFTNSEAQSTITFKSGQTVLMSGLLGTNETSAKDGVPFLSSLPIIGPAFGQQRTERNQSQLLVLITGTVVK